MSGSAHDADALVALLFEQEGRRLVALARFFTDDRTAAEDLVQEAFIRLARNAHRIRDARQGRGVPALDRRQPRPRPQPARPGLAAAPTAGRPRRAVRRGDRVPRRSRGARWWPPCARCRTAQRECVALRYYLELPVDEIADVLGLSPNSVKTHLKRGLRGLATALQATSEETHG